MHPARPADRNRRLQDQRDLPSRRHSQIRKRSGGSFACAGGGNIGRLAVTEIGGYPVRLFMILGRVGDDTAAATPPAFRPGLEGPWVWEALEDKE